MSNNYDNHDDITWWTIIAPYLLTPLLIGGLLGGLTIADRYFPYLVDSPRQKETATITRWGYVTKGVWRYKTAVFEREMPLKEFAGKCNVPIDSLIVLNRMPENNCMIKDGTYVFNKGTKLAISRYLDVVECEGPVPCEWGY